MYNYSGKNISIEAFYRQFITGTNIEDTELSKTKV